MRVVKGRCSSESWPAANKPSARWVCTSLCNGVCMPSHLRKHRSGNSRDAEQRLAPATNENAGQGRSPGAGSPRLRPDLHCLVIEVAPGCWTSERWTSRAANAVARLAEPAGGVGPHAGVTPPPGPVAAGLRHDDGLASDPPCSQRVDRRGHVGQRERAVDRALDVAGVDEPGDVEQGVSAHGRCEHPQVLGHEG